jgi:hypothetical protein
MRLLTILFAALLSFATLANTVETAQDLYSQRDLNKDGIAKAQQAADIYGSLVDSVEGVEKAEMLIDQSEALYFVGLITQFNGDKKKAKEVYWKGYEVGLMAANLLGDGPADKEGAVNPKDPANTDLLAKAMYWETVNCLRWGKLNGIFQSLGKWNTIGVPRLTDMLRLDYDVMNYGAHRSAGKALLTLPGNQKINGKSGLDFLEEAYYEAEAEAGDFTLSDNMATVTFYLEALRAAKMEGEFCEIYDQMVGFMEYADGDKDKLEEMFPDLAPEAKYEYAEFMNEKKNTKYYSKKCE